MNTDPKKLKFSLDLTAAAVLQGALVRHLAERQPAAVFDFRLLAAATEDIPALPDQPLRDTSQQVLLSVRTDGDRIELALQALGFAALKKCAGQRARLISDDRQIDRRFGFDQHGSGRIILESSHAVRAALSCLRVSIEGASTP